MKDRKLFIDLDGVLADFDGYYNQQFDYALDRNSPVDPPGMWNNIRAHGSFYADLPMTSDCYELWKGVRSLHPSPIILSGVPPYHLRRDGLIDVHEQKRKWVEKYIGKDVPLIMCLSAEKRLYARAGDILVDDWYKYRPLWEEMGGIFVLHTAAADSLAQLREIFQLDEAFNGLMNYTPEPE